MLKSNPWIGWPNPIYRGRRSFPDLLLPWLWLWLGSSSELFLGGAGTMAISIGDCRWVSLWSLKLNGYCDTTACSLRTAICVFHFRCALINGSQFSSVGYSVLCKCQAVSFACWSDCIDDINTVLLREMWTIARLLLELLRAMSVDMPLLSSTVLDKPGWSCQ